MSDKMVLIQSLFLSLSVLVLPVFTKVTVTTQGYSCIEEFHNVECDYGINNPDCDQFWSAQEHSIGTFVNFIAECHSPCEELFAGKIILDDCVNITLAVICTKEYLTEYRVHFYGIKIPQTIKNPVKRERIGVFLSVALLLCATLLYVLYWCWISAFQHHPN